MGEPQNKVERVLQIRLRALGDPVHVLPLIRSAAPFYRNMGAAAFRVLQNVDDPAQFTIQIDYEADAALELNRHKAASDPMVRSFVQGWRAILAGNVDMEVYEDVTR